MIGRLRRRTTAVTRRASTIHVRRRAAGITVAARFLAIVAITAIARRRTAGTSPLQRFQFLLLILRQDLEDAVPDFFFQVMQLPLLIIGKMDLAQDRRGNQDAQPPSGWAAATPLGLLVPEPTLTVPWRLGRLRRLSRGRISPGSHGYSQNHYE
jgi:hypothetical protein